MSVTRRNTITRNDAIGVAVVAAVAGVLATLAGCSPTGETIPDIVLCFALGAAVTWLSASAPWWALLAASALALGGSLGGGLVGLIAAVLAVLGAAWIGSERANQPIIRAAVGGLVVEAALRFEFDPFFLSSALIAAIALGLLGITGAQRRRKYVRKRIWLTAAGVAGVAVVATAGFGFVAAQHRTSFTDGYRAMLRGFDHVQAGDASSARDALWEASDALETASEGFDGLMGQAARFVPGVAQNRSAAVDVLASAAAAATTAAQALGTVDLDRLRVVDGAIDTTALADLAEPFTQLEAAVIELANELIVADSPWLVGPVRSRVETSIERAEQLVPQSQALAAAASVGPAMLGADGPRRYFIAFVNPAEARAHSGLMGNWSELTIDDGRLSVTRNGRTAELQRTLLETDVFVFQRPEFYDRLGSVGAGRPPDVPAQPNLWANITSSPDMVTVGQVMTWMYEANAGYFVDGVLVIDPAGIAALLKATGPIEIPALDFPLTADNVEQFLVLDQYEFIEADREELLEQVTDATTQRVLSGALPAPQVLARDMADAVLHGHISAWAGRPEEQELFGLIGMDAALPHIGEEDWVGDGLAVVSDNANPNKIDSFLHREISYDVQVDGETGELEGAVRIALRNDAPADGLDDYVLANAHALDRGTNRTVITLMTPHEVVEYRLDGEELFPMRNTELGWNTHRLIVELPPDGGTAVIEARVVGRVPPGTYELLVRPQPLPNADEYRITVTETRTGVEFIDHDEPILRRSVLTIDGISAWRP